jgi:hypothetical protein
MGAGTLIEFNRFDKQTHLFGFHTPTNHIRMVVVVCILSMCTSFAALIMRVAAVVSGTAVDTDDPDATTRLHMYGVDLTVCITR